MINECFKSELLNMALFAKKFPFCTLFGGGGESTKRGYEVDSIVNNILMIYISFTCGGNSSQEYYVFMTSYRTSVAHYCHITIAFIYILPGPPINNKALSIVLAITYMILFL